jgi:predicted nucleic acid-binding protein
MGRGFYMRIPKIYLETTMFNYYFDKDRDAHADTIKLFEEITAGKYDAYTSRAVIEELEKTKGDKREKMLNLIASRKIPILETSVEAEKLADVYVSEGVIPINYRTDGLHIAIATVNDLDMIISMNFQHIVKRKTVKMTAAINSINGYRVVEIYSPMEV